MNYFIYNDFKFSFTDEKNSTIQIGIGTCQSHNACDVCPPRIILPSHVEYQGNNYTLTIVSINAFVDCQNSTYVFIPKTIEIIKAAGFNAVVGEFYFEQGSHLKEIETAGIGWVTNKNFVLPPSVEILHNDSLRGFRNVKHFYYCGTTTFGNIEIFTTEYTVQDTPIIHVTPQYTSEYFGISKVDHHTLNCDIPFVYTCGESIKFKIMNQLHLIIIFLG